MHKLIGISLIAAGLAIASFAHAAKKPTVCLEFVETTLPVDGTPQKVAVCTDRKKPTILTVYSIQTVKDADGKSVRAAIGFR